MALSAFGDKAQPPQHETLVEVLAGSAQAWRQLILDLQSRWDPLEERWGFPGKKWGWSLCLKHKRRAILYMTPERGFFHVGFALGEKAVEAIRNRQLPEATLDLIESSQRFAEGRAVRFEVRTVEDLPSVVVVAKEKMAH